MPIKSFRGLMTAGAIDTITLHTNNGSTGYRIVKFTLMGHNPGDGSLGSYEHVVQIFKIPQDVASGTVDFSDNTLLAAGLCFGNTSPQFNDTTSILFDNEIFNQDIYVSSQIQSGGGSSEGVNFYLELEQVKLDMNEATVATLKDLRGSA